MNTSVRHYDRPKACVNDSIHLKFNNIQSIDLEDKPQIVREFDSGRGALWRDFQGVTGCVYVGGECFSYVC